MYGFEMRLKWSSKWFEICASCACTKHSRGGDDEDNNDNESSIDSYIEMVTILFESIVVCVDVFVFPLCRLNQFCLVSLLFIFIVRILFFSHSLDTVFLHTKAVFAARYLFQYQAIQTIWIPSHFWFGILYVCSHLIRSEKKSEEKPNGIVHTCHIRFVPIAIFVNFLFVHLIFLSNYVLRQCDTCSTVRNETILNIKRRKIEEREEKKRAVSNRNKEQIRKNVFPFLVFNKFQLILIPNVFCLSTIRMCYMCGALESSSYGFK